MVATKKVYGLAPYSDGLFTDGAVSKLKRLSNGASFPVAMASPPTVAAASTTSAVTGSIVSSLNGASPASSLFRFVKSNPAIGGGSYPRDQFVGFSNITDGNAGSPQATACGVEFMTDAPVFELYLYGSGISFRVLVDGAYVSTTPTTMPNDGDLYFIKHTFSARAPRRITIEATGAMLFGGVKVTALDQVWYPSTGTPLRMIVVGDSYVEGTGAAYQFLGVAQYAAGNLGVVDVWASGLGGTGYLATNGSRVGFRTRLAADVIAYAPDVVLTLGGINDTGNAALQTEVQAYHAAIRAGLPNVLNICLGPWNPHGASGTGLLAYIQNGAVAGDPAVVFIDNVTASWQSVAGGNVATPLGNGNGDVYLSSDSTHPSPAGHEYLGRRVADEIKRLISPLA